MAYTDESTVNARLGTYQEFITGDMADEDIRDFIDEADGIIDGYISTVVKLPLESTPKLISSISTDITVRNLWARTQARGLPEHVIRDYDNAIKLLEQIAKGLIKLEAKEHNDPSFFDAKYTAARRRMGVNI